MTTLLILDAAETMRSDYQVKPDGPLPTITCTLRGHLLDLTMTSFAGCPTFEKNGVTKIRFQAAVADTHGSLQHVTVWDAAAREMLKLTGGGLQALWESCAEEAGKTAFLVAMNRAKDRDYDLVLEISLREWKSKYSYQVNVNAAHEHALS